MPLRTLRTGYIIDSFDKKREEKSSFDGFDKKRGI